MREIWLPEALIVVFLALPFFRPFVKSLWPLDGLDWLPLVALILTLCIFPAYGFRPECLPLLAVAVFINAARFFFRPKDSFRRRSPLLPALSLALLVTAAVPMFVFSPRVNAGRGDDPQAARVLRIRTLDGDYRLLIYEAASAAPGAAAPLVFIVPPETGSAASVDLLCRELLNNGFTVVSYYRGSRGSSPFAMLNYRCLYRRAADRFAANEKGKALEAGRKGEVEYLLPGLAALLGKSGEPPLLLVGYGAGGSALAYMAGENRLEFLYGKVLGVVAVESRLWSSYREEARPAPEIPAAAGKTRYQWHLLTSRLRNMGPRKVVREGALPGGGPAGGLPVMYLVSGSALDAPQGQKPYQAVFDAFRQGSGPAVLAAVEGSGPLGYQDYPLTHPLYSLLLPGHKGAKAGKSPVGDTAAIVGNYAVFLLERAKEAEQERLRAIAEAAALEIAEEAAAEENIAETAEKETAGEEAGGEKAAEIAEERPPAESEIIIPSRQPIGGSLYFESKGMGGFKL